MCGRQVTPMADGSGIGFEYMGVLSIKEGIRGLGWRQISNFTDFLRCISMYTQLRWEYLNAFISNPVRDEVTATTSQRGKRHTAFLPHVRRRLDVYNILDEPASAMSADQGTFLGGEVVSSQQQREIAQYEAIALARIPMIVAELFEIVNEYKPKPKGFLSAKVITNGAATSMELVNRRRAGAKRKIKRGRNEAKLLENLLVNAKNKPEAPNMCNAYVLR